MELEKQLEHLYDDIAQLIKEAKTRVAVTANTELTLLYYKTGVYINQFILKESRGSYGKQVIIMLSALLSANYGKGWGNKHTRHCLRTAESFTEEQIVYAVRRQLKKKNILLQAP